MIRFDHVSFSHHGATSPTLRDVDLTIGDGEFVLVTGSTGAGKSTLLRACNGLVPTFTGGVLQGRVLVDGIDTTTRAPRDFAHLVGMVGQDPLAGFVSDRVEAELAYGMEQLGVDPSTMRRRVEETLDLLGIVDLRARPLRSLAGGQQQRVAIGSVLTMHPRVLVLDEPTSALDPTAAEDVLAALARLVHDLGVAVIVAEHRIERVIPFADRVLHVEPGGTVRDGTPADVLATMSAVPPLVELARLAQWEPMPLTVRDARRRVPGSTLAALPVPATGHPAPTDATTVLRGRGLEVRHGSTRALAGVDLDLHRGATVALMGRNGSGKSSLLWSLHGDESRSAGSVQLDGAATLVPQTASDLLLHHSVDRECSDADARWQVPGGTTRALLDDIAPGIEDTQHPRDLSAGQQLALVLAMQLAGAPDVVLLDEPTRGLDYEAKRRFTTVVRDLAARGAALLVATHDVEFAALVADRVVVLADGEVVADGDPATILCGSPAFAPQTSKVLGQQWLTVEQVRTALEQASP